MTRAINRLSPLEVVRLSEKGLYNDGLGLYLRISETGAKSWVMKYGIGGRMRAMGLGGWPAIGLAAARKLAKMQREKLAAGIDPINSRRAAVRAIAPRSTLPTFKALAEEVIAKRRAGWTNPKSESAWCLALMEYARELHDKAIDAITQADVEKLMLKHWTDRPETARRLRGRIDAVWKFARAKRLLPRDAVSPAEWKDHLSIVMPESARPKHHSAMKWPAVPEFMAELRGKDGPAPLCLRFIILTGVRSGEARGASWDEIELQDGLWTIPASRTKTRRREHVVPISTAAADVLHEAARFRSGRLVFESMRKDRPLSEMAFKGLLPENATVHGFRSTFADWCREVGRFDDILIETALSHVVGTRVERAYKRGVLIEARREMMEAWARFSAAAA